MSGPQRLSGAGGGAGVRHFNPLALTSHLPPPRLSWWRVRPSQGWVDGDSRPYPFLGGSGSLHSTPPAPPSESAFLTVCATWIPPRGVELAGGAGGRSGSLLCRGVGLGGNCIDFSSQAGRCGAERPSPEPGQHTLWGRRRSRARRPPNARPTPTQRLPDDRPPAGHSWAGICHVSSSPVTPASPTPSSALAPALHTPAPTRRRRRRGRGEVALLGVLPRGAWARAPGCAHLSERQREMNNLGRPRRSCRPVLTSPRPLPRGGRSGRSSPRV